MMECMIIGDSIAVGVKSWLEECSAVAKVGITTQQWLSRFSHVDIKANGVIISLGSNDGNTQQASNLEKLRMKISAKTVVWILPAINPHVQRIIVSIAKTHGDHVLEIQNTTLDKVHPTPREYQRLAAATKILFW